MIDVIVFSLPVASPAFAVMGPSPNDRFLVFSRAWTQRTTLIARRGRPKSCVSDNGTELTGMAMLKWTQMSGVDWHYIAPGKPQQNAFVGDVSFGSVFGNQKMRALKGCGFANDIRPLFSDEDITNMRTYFDLGSYDDNKARAEDNLRRLKGEGGSRRMPPPPRPSWPLKDIELYQRWIADGCLP